MRRSFLCILSLLVMLFTLPAWGQTTPGEQRVDAYLRSIREQPSLLLEFMRQMPKGADIHNHLPGAIYAESYIKWAAQDGLCIDRKTLAAMAPEPVPMSRMRRAPGQSLLGPGPCRTG